MVEKENKIKALTQYRGFTVLKSLEAASERIEILKDILGISDNLELLNIAKNDPEKILSNLGNLYDAIGPRSMGINPTPVCNRQCTFCSSRQRNKINIEDNIEITEDKLRKVFEDFISMKGGGCVLVGGGEALLACKGKLNEVINDYDLYYGFNTNGVNLDKFTHEKLLEKTKWVSLSLIGHNKDTYNSTAGLDSSSGQFDVLNDNLKKYIEIADDLNREGKSHPYISAKILICRENYLYSGEIYNYAKYLGFKDISLRCVNNFEIEEEYRKRKIIPQDIELTKKEKEQIKSILTKETDLSEEIIFNILGLRDKIKNDTVVINPTLCWNVVLGLIINLDTNGEVFLCNPRIGMESFSIGNINSMSLKSLWSGSIHVDVVKKTYKTFNKGACDLSKCRHFRVDQVIEQFLEGKISLKDRSFGDKQMSFFP
ncbi:MAG: SPASM domain-containing protein [Parcubacteria group bacterium]|nr:SPASM domain-containing protein [Parcubacteria group bacterium]MCR4342306.1 SPASM domain-containing protein [Patescibacteria group bacterium]